MSINRLPAVDDKATDRSGDIIRFLRRTTSGDVDVDLSAVIGVAAMMFLHVNELPFNQHSADECISRIVDALEGFYQEHANAQ